MSTHHYAYPITSTVDETSSDTPVKGGKPQQRYLLPLQYVARADTGEALAEVGATAEEGEFRTAVAVVVVAGESHAVAAEEGQRRTAAEGDRCTAVSVAAAVAAGEGRTAAAVAVGEERTAAAVALGEGRTAAAVAVGEGPHASTRPAHSRGHVTRAEPV